MKDIDPLVLLIEEQAMLREKLRSELPEALKPLFERYLSIRNQVEPESENRDFELGLVLGARLLPHEIK